MSNDHKGNPVATYIITALILGVITYIEFALVEYDISWLSRTAVIFWLVALSLVKFVMVVAIFMHLKDDEKTYTGFFSSGMVLALATFIILPLLFTLSSFPYPARAESEAHVEESHAEAEALPGELRELIESDGYSRSAADQLDTPRPKDRSLVVEPPAAADPEATLAQDGAAGAEEGGQEQEAEEPATETQAADADQQPGQQPTDQQAQAAGQEQVEAQEPQADEQQATAEIDHELGQSVYSSICQGCHQAEGAGLPGVFPPLGGGHLAELHNAGGREYLVDVVLHGISGSIEVNGQTYTGSMPAWAGSLSDEQVAAVLNHGLNSWGNEEVLEEFTPISTDEVAQNRSEDAGNLLERRAALLGE